MLARVFETERNTRLHLKRDLSLSYNTFLLFSFTFQLFRAVMRACTFFWVENLSFFLLPFTFHKCRFSSSLPFLLIFWLSCVLVSFVLRGIVHFAVALDYGERAFTTRPCANIFYVFKVWCSYVDSLLGISTSNILKCCF